MMARHLSELKIGSIPFHRSVVMKACKSAGLTLIELMIALVLMLLVSLAATSLVSFGSNSYNNLDQINQLRDNARFARELITRSVLQAGYQDLANGVVSRRDATLVNSTEDPEPDIRGYNNSVKKTADIRDSEHGTRTSSNCSNTTTACINGSDILIVRYQAAATSSNNTVADGSMVNCFGSKDSAVISSSADRAMSAFYITTSAGEPSLACGYITSGGTTAYQPLIQGVESLQFLYGVDNVTPTLATPAATPIDNVANRFFRADQIDVPGNEKASRENWRRVRSVKVGMIVRGPVGSAVDKEASGKTLLVFGPGSEGIAGDEKTEFTPAKDGRLRTAVTFTIHLRNDQHLR
jgi:type IV pilus assembly protein PilW